MLQADVLALLFDEDSAREKRIPADPYKELRYLVVEDQEVARQTLKICINSMGGFSVDMAQSFPDAVYRIQRHMPDVIICDYMLGNGRTGQQLLEDLRRTNRLPDTVSFIMVTAERSYEQVVSAVELAPDDYIIKPFSPDTLRTRMERVIRKKIFFHVFHQFKTAGEFDAALAELENLEAAAEGRQYRFDILRGRAETLLAADRLAETLDCYGAILDIYPFPWALAGKARVLQRLTRYDEARDSVDAVIAATPAYFDAYDLKADICCDLGRFDEAQSILRQAADRTPRNWQRKRILSSVAKLNGDFDTARQLMEEIIANDHVGGFSIADRLELARTALEAGDMDLARKTMGEITPEDRQSLLAVEKLNVECIEALLEGGDGGEKRFDRIRFELSRAELTNEAALDVVRAAFAFSDLQLADQIAEKLLTGQTARRAFQAMLEAYRKQDMEVHFRQLQQVAATRRLQRKPR